MQQQVTRFASRTANDDDNATCMISVFIDPPPVARMVRGDGIPMPAACTRMDTKRLSTTARASAAGSNRSAIATLMTWCCIQYIGY
jgi:hypothetical protein